MRKVATSIKDSIWAEYLSAIDNLGLSPSTKVNKNDRTITLFNGAVFEFKGADDIEKVKSIQGISDIVLEEATEFTLDDFTQLTLRLRGRHTQKQIFLMFNPVSKANWVYKYFFENEPPAKTKIIQSTYKDNKFIDERTLTAIENLKDRNPAYYRIYALGEFATLDKLVFPTYEKRLLNPNSPELINLPDYFAMDFGFVNDPTAFVRIKIDETNKTIYFLQEYVRTGMTNDVIAKVIKELGYAKEYITADSNEIKSIVELRQFGIDRIVAVKKGKNSIVHGLDLMSEYKLVIDERAVHMLEELENYTWQKDKSTGEYINDPIDTFNHVIDATRYALQGYFATMPKRQG
jgi:phage terminase large subunit